MEIVIIGLIIFFVLWALGDGPRGREPQGQVIIIQQPDRRDGGGPSLALGMAIFIILTLLVLGVIG